MNGKNTGTRKDLAQRGSQGRLEKFQKPLLEYLTSGLEHPDTRVRCLAADMLGALGDDKALVSLVPLMVSEDPELREAALRSVEKLKNLRIEISHCRTAGCDSCLIRSIAEEALARIRSRNPGMSGS